jgi:hypothetical protein
LSGGLPRGHATFAHTSLVTSSFQPFSFYPRILQPAAVLQLPEMPAAHVLRVPPGSYWSEHLHR